MKLLHISDTHNLHHQLDQLPQADIIVHSGDFCENGTEDEVLNFINWFIELPYKHKIFVTGNHDLCLIDADNIEELPEMFISCKTVNVRLMVSSFWGWVTIIPSSLYQQM